MSEWRGLHNPERHAPTSVTDMAWCNVCDGPCYSTEACCCCLAAEVKRLERAEAAIARVRDVCDRIWDDARYAHKYGFLEVVREVRYALDGDSDD